MEDGEVWGVETCPGNNKSDARVRHSNQVDTPDRVARVEQVLGRWGVRVRCAHVANVAEQAAAAAGEEQTEQLHLLLAVRLLRFAGNHLVRTMISLADLLVVL